MVREKRTYTRITLDIPASLSIYQVETCHAGAIANISLSGCFFPFIGELPVGEECYLTITVGEGIETEEIAVTGKIVRSDSAGVGIHFLDNPPKSRLQLEKLIVQKTTEELFAEKHP